MMTLDRVRNFIDAHRCLYGKTPAVIELQEDEYEQLCANVNGLLINPKPGEPIMPTAAFGVPIRIINI